MPTFGAIITPMMGLKKSQSSESSIVDSNSNLAYIKQLHSVTNDYSKTAT